MLDTRVVNVRSGYSCSTADYRATVVVEVQMKSSRGRVEHTGPAGTKTPVQNAVGKTAPLVAVVGLEQCLAELARPMRSAQLPVDWLFLRHSSHLCRVACYPVGVHLADGPPIR